MIVRRVRTSAVRKDPVSFVGGNIIIIECLLARHGYRRVNLRDLFFVWPLPFS